MQKKLEKAVAKAKAESGVKSRYSTSVLYLDKIVIALMIGAVRALCITFCKMHARPFLIKGALQKFAVPDKNA